MIVYSAKLTIFQPKLKCQLLSYKRDTTSLCYVNSSNQFFNYIPYILEKVSFKSNVLNQLLYFEHI